MFRGEGERRSFSLPRNITVIGRREDCDLRIPLGEVSRKHCRLIAENESVRVEDLGSSNGTFLNGQRIQEAPVNPGDVVQIGPVMFVVQIDGVPADDDIRAPQMAAPTVADNEDTNMAVAAAAAAGRGGADAEADAELDAGLDLDDEIAAAAGGGAKKADDDDLMDLALEEIEEEKPRRNG